MKRAILLLTIGMLLGTMDGFCAVYGNPMSLKENPYMPFAPQKKLQVEMTRNVAVYNNHTMYEPASFSRTNVAVLSTWNNREDDWGYEPLRTVRPKRAIIDDDDDNEHPGYEMEDPFKTPIGDGVGVMMVLAMAYLLFRKFRISRRIRIRRD